MTSMAKPSLANMPSDRKRKAPIIMVGSQSRTTNKLSRSDKLAKLLAVEEMAAFRRRRRRSFQVSEVLDQAGMKLWRQRVVQWFFDVVDHFELPRDVVYVASVILDCYTTDYTIDSVISSSHYREVSIASIFLAAKTLKPSRMPMESLLQTVGKTSGKMTLPQAMEAVRRVVSALDWTYPILVPSVFVKQLFGMAAPFFPAGQSMSLPLEHMLYLTELAVLGDLSSSRSFASDIALAALLQTLNPKTGPADCCLTQESFQLSTEKLGSELNLDCSNNETIQFLCQEMAGIHAQSLGSISSHQEPKSTPSKPTPVLIEEDSEQETSFEETIFEEKNQVESSMCRSPAKRIRTI
ncbi:unnamed protein product [Cylindrotheca closterium]|uniref:Cyclin N-terminal domain-containing protein n=1 Tax=Cylindrotheca closterium TaxID=2856 RepID=A0AAD2PXF9_9STRA|nr:unnamed protein product [Cylindrotheca closterium]